jgi:hypothetical protein
MTRVLQTLISFGPIPLFREAGHYFNAIDDCIELKRRKAISTLPRRARVLPGNSMFLASVVFAVIAIALPVAFTLFGARLRR